MLDGDRKKQYRAAYYANHRDNQLAASRAWKAANPDRAREHNRLSQRRVYHQKKAAERRRQAARERYAANRDQERERSRQYRVAHPEQMRQYARRFRERHPERAAEQNRRANQAWRDRNAARVRETNRERAATGRSNDPDAYKRWYEANLERQRARGREASQLRSRLKKLGLPPRRIHRVYAADKRTHTAHADAFFARTRTPADIAALTREEPRSTRPARTRIADRNRVKENISRQDQAREHDAVLARLPGLVDAYRHEHGERIREEVRMDSIARLLRGKPGYDLNTVTEQRIWDTVTRQEAPGLDPRRIAQLRAAQTARPTPATVPVSSSRVQLLADLQATNDRQAAAVRRRPDNAPPTTYATPHRTTPTPITARVPRA